MLKKKVDEHLSLMDALGFDEDDLQANADGHLSERQRQLFKSQYGRLIRWGLIVGVIAVGLIVFLMIVFAYNICAASTVAFALISLVLLMFYQQTFKDWAKLNTVLRFPVESAEGVIVLDLEGGSSNVVPKYVIKLGQVRFEVDKSIFLAFKNGDPYRLYFVADAMLLSAESLRTE
jgi:hypothetical protein